MTPKKSKETKNKTIRQGEAFGHHEKVQNKQGKKKQIINKLSELDNQYNFETYSQVHVTLKSISHWLSWKIKKGGKKVGVDMVTDQV